MKKIFCKLLLLMLICIASTANAEVQTYTGVGEYIMSEFETLDIAKQRAKQKAERAAQEQAGVFVSSYTKVNNHQVTEDEIVTITCGILNVIDSQYKLTPLEDGKSVLISATVNVKIDSADVDKWLDKAVAQRTDFVKTNEPLRKTDIERDRQISVRGYTGVVVDASGMGMETTFSPVIYDTKGREIYGIKNLDVEIVMELGMVSYSTSVNDKTVVDRAGKNPLVVRAVEIRGGGNSANKVNAVISVEDANKILRANKMTHMLDRCAVVFVN